MAQNLTTNVRTEAVKTVSSHYFFNVAGTWAGATATLEWSEEGTFWYPIKDSGDSNVARIDDSNGVVTTGKNGFLSVICSGGTAATFDAMVVEGAGTAAANGTYLRDGDSGGKPRYTLVGGTTNEDSIVGGNSGWVIFNDETLSYNTGESVATPDLVVSWTGTNPPIPTVRRPTMAELLVLAGTRLQVSLIPV